MTDKKSETKEFVAPLYGVADSPEQLAKYLYEHKAGKKIYYMKCIKRSGEPSYGGWRWHKWGQYIGEFNLPDDLEYLYDANGKDGMPLIDEQWVFTNQSSLFYDQTYLFESGKFRKIKQEAISRESIDDRIDLVAAISILEKKTLINNLTMIGGFALDAPYLIKRIENAKDPVYMTQILFNNDEDALRKSGLIISRGGSESVMMAMYYIASSLSQYTIMCIKKAHGEEAAKEIEKILVDNKDNKDNICKAYLLMTEKQRDMLLDWYNSN